MTREEKKMLIQKLAELKADINYHNWRQDRWNACENDLLEIEDALDDIDIQTALYDILLSIDRELEFLDKQAIYAAMSDPMNIVGLFADPEADSLFQAAYDTLEAKKREVKTIRKSIVFLPKRIGKDRYKYYLQP